MKILMIEDDDAIRDLTQIALMAAGFENVVPAVDGKQGLALAKKELPDLILLDLMLPKLDGLSVCRALREDEATRKIPIIMLTAKSEESDIVLGLELGANDYITKPFSNKVLIARIRAQLRSREQRSRGEVIKLSELVINAPMHLAVLGRSELDLTATEFSILELLARNPGRVWTRGQIVSRIKGNDYPVTDRAIDVQILNLRRKLGDWASNIETIRGVGYRMKLIED